jgi:secondary thiamine-phosphate synthase enzyme
MIKRALTLVNAMHITASVFINDDESGLHHDYEVWLERLAPHAPIDQYWHNRTGEDNADAHLKRQVMGREVVVAVTNGRLDFGTWERILYSEFDSRRRKRLLVKIIGEQARSELSCVQWVVALVRHNKRTVCTAKWPGLRIKLSVPGWIAVSS